MPPAPVYSSKSFSTKPPAPSGGPWIQYQTPSLANGTFGGGVNVYYKNQAFSGNYAVRFNMNMVIGTGGFTIEGPLFGINHNGLETNWWLATTANFSGGPWASDGVWYWTQAPPDGAGGPWIQY